MRCKCAGYNIGRLAKRISWIKGIFARQSKIDIAFCSSLFLKLCIWFDADEQNNRGQRFGFFNSLVTLEPN
jgi:hypothetical protein